MVNRPWFGFGRKRPRGQLEVPFGADAAAGAAAGAAPAAKRAKTEVPGLKLIKERPGRNSAATAEEVVLNRTKGVRASCAWCGWGFTAQESWLSDCLMFPSGTASGAPCLPSLYLGSGARLGILEFFF